MSKKNLTISNLIKDIQEEYKAEKLCSNYFSYLGNKYKDLENSEDLKLLRNITSYHMTPEDTWKPFDPQMIFRGRRSAIPDDLTEEEIEKLEKCYTEVQDQELKARIADTLWLKKRNVKYAHDAVNFYIESAKIVREKSWTYSIDRIERAFRLSLSLGKGGKEDYESVLKYILEILNKFDLEKEAYFPMKLLDLLLEISYKNVDFCIKITKECSEFFEKNDIYRQNDYLELLAKFYEKNKDQGNATNSRTTIAENHVKSVDFEDSAMGKAHCLTKAIEIFRRIGNKSKAEELHKQLLDIQKKIPSEMQTFHGPAIDISQSIQAAINHVKNKEKEDALLHFCFVVQQTNIEEAFNTVEEQSKQFIHSSLFGKSTVNKDGKTVAHTQPKLESAEEKRENRLFPDLVEHLGINWNLAVRGSILPALEQIMLEHDMSMKDLQKFVINNPLIRPGHEQLVLQGLLFGFQEKWDLAGKILLIEFEDSMRFLLEKRGILTSNIKNDFTQDERGTSYFFTDCEDVLIEIFGKDTFYELKVLISKDNNGNGFNLRNLIAHGLMTQNELYTDTIVYFWWLIFKLICIPTIKSLGEKN
ncbi:DUF4209 domain-containing protein [Candidatus Gracilibacteria bacterium]|nr:DUF4209 domain-containing protein [Candidatus Gracilibacteria bacterium]MCF7819720.1 DUF4209 domain-containing protein [Candidatus Gracilibacteria bacterium]